MHSFGNFILRRYQEKALEAFEKWLPLAGDKLGTVILPTGTGKTKLACACINIALQTKPYKILWCAHREELISQAFKELSDILPNINIEIEMADQRASANADVVVGTVQTLHRSRKNMLGFVPDIVVVDEWHHYDEQNKQYAGLMDKFPEAKFLGLTATPFRFMGGDLPLGTKLIEMDIGLAVAHNYLVPPKPEALKSDVSLADVKTRAGDFAINELSVAVNVEKRNRLIADRIIKAVREEKRQGLLFGVDVAHAKAMTKMLEKEVRTGEVYGETDKDERRALMEKARNKEIDVLVNNLCLTEGLDLPHMSFVCIARPTKSLGCYVQMLGRGLRPSEGKTDCLVIDVHDTIKISQKRITYKNVQSSGDIDSSRRRFDSILKEKIADKIENFPVVIRLRSGERWTVDEESWFAPSWLLDDNQWVLAWTKTSESIETDNPAKEWVQMRKWPQKEEVKNKPFVVLHEEFGEGIAHDVEFGFKECFLIVDFDKHGTKNVPPAMLKRESIKFEKRPLKNPIRKAFYICLSQDGSKGRMISLRQEGREFFVDDDIVGDKVTINESLKVAADKDDMNNVLRSDAKWRSRIASDKQKEYINKMITWGKLETDIDIDKMTGGEASSLIDQINWKDVINRIFGAKTRKNLIGYNSDQDDI